MSFNSQCIALKIPANSTAIYPDPETATFFGFWAISKKPSLVIVNSTPGKVSNWGLPPVETKMCFAVYVLVPVSFLTSTVRGPTNFAF